MLSCWISNSGNLVRGSRGFQSCVVHEEVGHLLLQVLHIVLQFTRIGLISCTDITALRWTDCLLRLYMGADKASRISLIMLTHLTLNQANLNFSWKCSVPM